jgi:hypothetical protein
VVATDDGGVTMLLSAGGGIQLNKDQWPSGAATRLITTAADFMLECAPAWSYPLPESGMVRFYLLTFDGVLGAEAPPKELASGKSPFSDLYYNAHDVLVLARMATQNPDWSVYTTALQAPDAMAVPPHPVPATSAATPATPATPAGAAPQAAPMQAAAPERQPLAPPPPPADDLLLRAAARNDVDAVAKLLADGHDHEPNVKGVTPLMAAAHAGALEPLRLLLAAGAPVDAQEQRGYTALMLAGSAGHEVCLRLLLGAGATVEARDDEGMTPLMLAAQNGHTGIVRILMERGADPNATNGHGASALSLARQNGHDQTVSILSGGYELPKLG